MNIPYRKRRKDHISHRPLLLIMSPCTTSGATWDVNTIIIRKQQSSTTTILPSRELGLPIAGACWLTCSYQITASYPLKVLFQFQADGLSPFVPKKSRYVSHIVLKLLLHFNTLLFWTRNNITQVWMCSVSKDTKLLFSSVRRFHILFAVNSYPVEAIQISHKLEWTIWKVQEYGKCNAFQQYLGVKVFPRIHCSSSPHGCKRNGLS